MLLRWIPMLAVALTVGLAASAPAAVKIRQFEAGVIDSVGMAADRKGNVYVLSEFAYISKVAPDGTRTFLPFDIPVPAEMGPNYGRSLVWGPDDALWFNCNHVTCHVDGDGGGLIDSPSFGYGTPGIDGSFWSVDTTARTVTRTTPTGVTTVFQGLPACTSVSKLMVGADQKMWFFCGQALVSVSSSGTITARPLSAELVPYGAATAGADGNFWVAASQSIARVSPEGTVLGQYPLTGTPTSMTLGPDDDVWFTYFGEGGVGRVSPSGLVSEFGEQMGSGSTPHQIVRAADGGLWVEHFYQEHMWRFDPDPPTAVTGASSGTGPTTTTVGATVNPLGGPTTASFAYGPTSAYGERTPSRTVGDGEAGVLTSEALTGLAPGTTYHYRVTAVNGMRTVHGADRTFTTAPAPPEPPKPGGDDGGTVTGASIDGDGDGYPAGVDCDERVASVHPGAVDRPGDKVDQDCSGSPAAWGHLAPSVDARWSTQRRTTRFTRLTLGALPTKATVSLACRGGGCGFKTYRIKTVKATGHLGLLARLKGSRLRRGATVELRLAAAGQATTVIRWRIGPPTRRTTTCLPPGERREGPCA